ncbi:MAG: sigma-54-dependent Fis family transcriptional regulator [Candidatus Omnitrophica bacterium]|nr:sigma-54-dependent Fis family transcriptional regulator [Candidatus Omnitrophota bacterium]
MKPCFLVIDDDEVTRLLVESHLQDLGFNVRVGSTATDLREAIHQGEYYAVFLDIYLPDGNGIELIHEIQQALPNIPVIMITGDGRIETVVEAMQAGAADYCPKPLELPRLKITAKNAVERYNLQKTVTTLERANRSQLGELMGASAPMQLVYHIIETAAPTKAPVLITGESGCGKELAARAIHRLSPRSERELVDVNCAAIPKDLLESELFGHEKSAFTGAMKRSFGRCERAHQSTLFLDEIGEMNYNLQAKMLRFLQEYAFYRVGGQEKIVVDVRVISATNRNPLEAIGEGRLREDLYYRLNVVNIHLPPLRERTDDIPLLADYFMDKYSREHGKKFRSIHPEALTVMESYSWPGNVRELENCIQQVIVLYEGQSIEVHMLPEPMRSMNRDAPMTKPVVPPPAAPPVEIPIEMDSILTDRIIPLNELEKKAIDQALALTHGNVGQAAVGLQMSQATLYRKVREYGLNIKEYK